MNAITLSQSSTDSANFNCEFRRIPIADLCFPTRLFDRRAAGQCGNPEMLIPLAVYQSTAGFIVIDGCKRLLHAQKTGQDACNCSIVTPAPDEHHAALLRISLNRNRVLHFFEKLLFSAWIKEYCTEPAYSEACALLSLESRERFEFEQLAACDQSVIDAVYDGALEPCSAPDADRIDPPDREALLTFLRQHRFSRQMQRELLDWLPEIGFREKSTLHDICASSWLQEIEQNPKLNGPQKIDHLRSVIFNRRFPTLARAKSRWAEHAAKLNPDPDKVLFKPSEAFEKNRLEMRISITSAEQATNIFSRLNEIKPEMWDRLIYPAQLQNETGNQT
jgi:hypothetical protein